MTDLVFERHFTWSKAKAHFINPTPAHTNTIPAYVHVLPELSYRLVDVVNGEVPPQRRFPVGRDDDAVLFPLTPTMAPGIQLCRAFADGDCVCEYRTHIPSYTGRHDGSDADGYEEHEDVHMSNSDDSEADTTGSEDDDIEMSNSDDSGSDTSGSEDEDVEMSQPGSEDLPDFHLSHSRGGDVYMSGTEPGATDVASSSPPHGHLCDVDPEHLPDIDPEHLPDASI
ncbi:hypothetical protein QBC34DRAFT_382484 [Podospora aff. communis PSN243]|uniref:Uncharacterized protein n=1 Tax=Podospora aff. communis PSN243 TaxID=3040156 RepID=A0AAV9GGF1_9PEZI|nr:hypothetical protein QBC34DRAFT_382484 [Podospora aff. communis PSN243]